MNILYITYPLSGLLIFTLVIGLAIFIVRKYQLGWRLFFIGAATFIGVQLFHIPFNWLVLQRLALLPTEPATTASTGCAESRVEAFHREAASSAGSVVPNFRAMTQMAVCRSRSPPGEVLRLGSRPYSTLSYCRWRRSCSSRLALKKAAAGQPFVGQ